MEVSASQKNKELADKFLLILETVQRRMQQLQACVDKQESCTAAPTTPPPTQTQSPKLCLGADTGRIVDHAHRFVKNG